ncbi:hypothetical protein V2J94_38155 [Streptomyces sp. DSM 41524]|uniref:Immunity protein 35 domain-containing protein n=1 Tax=Streptomyces asiaticus subsp. ignotus TaxID=3098222 RepID=A0ABU7Q8E3_9ACTN|nr:hypothetical protein [Streptomyces sp. DSM 41524]
MAMQGPSAHEVAQRIIASLGWLERARVRAGALPHQARIVNEAEGVWIGINGGATVTVFSGLVEAGRYRDPAPGSESGEVSPDDGDALVAAARAVLDRAAKSAQ